MMFFRRLTTLNFFPFARLFWLAIMLTGCLQTSPQVPPMQGHIDTLNQGVDKQLVQAHEALLRGDYQVSLNKFQDIINQGFPEPINTQAWYGLAASADMLGEFVLAERSYQHLQTSHGQTARFLNNYGYSKLLQGQYSQAHGLFTQALSVDPDNAYSQNNLQMLRHAMQQSLNQGE